MLPKYLCVEGTQRHGQNMTGTQYRKNTNLTQKEMLRSGAPEE